MSVHRDSERWTYFVGAFPFGHHAAGNRRMFQVLTSQLINGGFCRQAEVIAAFGVPKISVARALRRYRDEGMEAFFRRRRGRRGGTVLTGTVLATAQGLLDDGLSRAEVAEELGVKRDTLRKAIDAGRLRGPTLRAGSDKSWRSVQDATAAEGMGTACTRTMERVLASMGMLDGAPARFEHCRDVPYGGVLCALPALLANGLLEGAERFLNPLKGYYTMVPVLVLMAFMALCRIRTLEQMRGKAPGEAGKLVGLDRVPEVRCLRRKLSELGDHNAAERWSAHLSQQWMEAAPDAAGTLYVDGHVRVYHGSQTALPRRYVSRQRLCLRGITDYWVNDALGLPFFVVAKTVDAGLVDALRHDIVPRLLREVPGQPSADELLADPWRCRFLLVFDREAYSPVFFRDMWTQHRIGCLTYHKHPRDDWPAAWFENRQLTMPNGEVVTMPLAEMGSLVGSGKDAMWMREVRKLTDSGHQVSLISTAFGLPHTEVAPLLFTRWCQENFFKYMMQHFALDLLGEYGTAPLPDTQRVVNPAWRGLDKRRNTLRAKLVHRQAKFAAMTLHPETDPHRFERWQRHKAELLEEIEHGEAELDRLKETLRNTEHHIAWEQLPEAEKFHRLAPTRKQLMDTVRMIAYRAETAMVPLVRDEHTDSAAARAILQELFLSSADLIPQPEQQRLRVRIHRSSRPATDRRLERLCAQLNEAEMNYPGTTLQLVYELAAPDPPHPPDGLKSVSAR